MSFHGSTLGQESQLGTSAGKPREIAVPGSVFESIRAEAASFAGTLQAVRALHLAGYRAGVEASAALNHEAGGNAFALTEVAFWSSLSGFFAKRGWGSFEHRSPHRAIGVLETSDWAEARPDSFDPEATCGFTTGYLCGLLTQLSGAPIAVLEISCRSRGQDTCEFAFGAESVIHDLYGSLLDGAEITTALKAL